MDYGCGKFYGHIRPFVYDEKDDPRHSPEIEYRETGRNGIMTSGNLGEYAQAVVALLQNPDRLQSLKQGCRESACRYSMEQMVDNFKEGVIKCLANA